MNEMALRVSKPMFSYQVLLALEPPIDFGRLLEELSSTLRAIAHGDFVKLATPFVG